MTLEQEIFRLIADQEDKIEFTEIEPDAYCLCCYYESGLWVNFRKFIEVFSRHGFIVFDVSCTEWMDYKSEVILYLKRA